MPRAASVWRPEAARPSALRSAFAPARRLRTAAQFAAVAAAARPAAVWRGGRRYLTVQARIVAMQANDSRPPVGTVRVGVTAGKRQARRAVERSRVKRVLREAARHALAALDAAAAGRQVDLVLRLKAPVPAAELMNRARFKLELRAEADALLAQLAGFLRQGDGGAAR